MILPDVNLLVYAFNASAPAHQAALAWWTRQMNGHRRIGIAWPVLQGFVRLLTSPRIVAEPYTIQEVFAFLEEWWARPHVLRLEPTDAVYREYRDLCLHHSLSASTTTDALIAAYALAHDGVLHTNDRDFSRFTALRLVNPLAR